MPIAAVSKKQIEYPHNVANASAIRVLLEALRTAVNAGAQVVNSLSADSPGRGIIAAGYFDAATVALKFAAGAFAANSTIRALFAAGLFDLATATSVFAANSIDESKLARRVAAQALSGAGAINKTAITTLFTSTGAAQALTLADGDFASQRKRVIHIADGGSGVITQTSGAKLTASITTITFTNIWDWVELEWSGTLWNVVGYTGVTIA